MMENSHRFFQNRSCPYFPCHPVEDDTEFNCLFCYCPLYALGDRCGGNCVYTDDGIKDCSRCLLPHRPKGYDYINDKFRLLAELASQNRSK
jgi:Zn-finger protein